MKSSSSDQTKADFPYGFDFLFSFLEGLLSTGLKPCGADIFSFLDDAVGLADFFLRRVTFDLDLEHLVLEGPDSVRVLSASSAEEEEMMIAFLDVLLDEHSS